MAQLSTSGIGETVEEEIVSASASLSVAVPNNLAFKIAAHNYLLLRVITINVFHKGEKVVMY